MNITHAETGSNCWLEDGAVIGYEYRKGCGVTQIGNDAIIRTGTIIYGDVIIGNGFRTGHHALIRENTKIGNNVLVGTNAVIDGYCDLGDNIKIQTGVYISTATIIGNNVFIGPCAVLLNDKYPGRAKYELKGPEIGDEVSIGGNATILPGIRIGTGSFIAAGAIVTRDVPPEKMAIGSPASIVDLPQSLRGRKGQ